MSTTPGPGDDLDDALPPPPPDGRSVGVAATVEHAPGETRRAGADLEPISSAALERRGGATITQAVGGLSARMDALSTATTSFRSVLGERLTDFGEQVDRAQASSGRDLDHYRRLHEKAMVDIEAALYDSERSLARLDIVAARLLARLDETAQTLTGLVSGGNEHLTQEIGWATAGVNAALVHQGEVLGSLERTTSDGFSTMVERVEDLTFKVAAHAGGTVAVKDAIDASLAAVHAEAVSGAARDEEQAVLVRDALEALRSQVAELAPASERSPDPALLGDGAAALDAGGIHDRLEEVVRLVSAQRPVDPPDLTPLLSSLSEIGAGVTGLSERPPATDMSPVLDSLAALHGTIGSLTVADADGAATRAAVERIEVVVDALADASEDQLALRNIAAEIAGFRAAIDAPGRPAGGVEVGGDEVGALMARLDAAAVEQDRRADSLARQVTYALTTAAGDVRTTGDSAVRRIEAALLLSRSEADRAPDDGASSEAGGLPSSEAGGLRPSVVETGAFSGLLTALGASVDRLAEAQEVSFQQVIEAVEDSLAAPRATPGDPALVERLARLEVDVSGVSAARTAGTAGASGEGDTPASGEGGAPASGEGGDPDAVATQLAALVGQVEALRRRLAVRTRPEAGLDADSIDKLAEALAVRLRDQPGAGGVKESPGTGADARRSRRG